MKTRVPKKSKNQVLPIILIFITLLIVFFVFKKNSPKKVIKSPPSAYLIDDSVNKKVKLFLKDGYEEIGVNEEAYLVQPDGTIIKGSYNQFVVSSDNNFLFYTSLTNQNTINFYLFDKQQRKNNYLDLDIDSQNFTSDSKYFYACGKEAAVFQLPEKKSVFLSGRNHTYFKCLPSEDNKKIIFSEFKDSSEKDLISTYELSVGSGVFKKI